MQSLLLYRRGACTGCPSLRVMANKAKKQQLKADLDEACFIYGEPTSPIQGVDQALDNICSFLSRLKWD